MQSGTGRRQEEGLCVMVERSECKYIRDGEPQSDLSVDGVDTGGWGGAREPASSLRDNESH